MTTHFRKIAGITNGYFSLNCTIKNGSFQVIRSHHESFECFQLKSEFENLIIDRISVLFTEKNRLLELLLRK